jgi:hypothetical protein
MIVRRTAIQNSSQIGISATSCDVTMDEDIVGPANAGGGISLTNSDFTITNALVIGNGGTLKLFGGIQATWNGTASRAKIVNCTIVENTAKNQAGVYSGLDCSAITTTTNTAIIGNLNAPTEVKATCPLDHSASIGATGSGNIDLTGCTEGNLFAAAGTNYTPVSTPMAPCTKVLVNAATPAGAPDHDLKGSPRPQPAGSNPDVGAIEAP